MTDTFTTPMLRPLGQTGMLVSPLGLGTVKFGRNTDVKYPESFQIPDDKALIKLFDLAKELGINLLDTAPAYGNSEQRIGDLLSGRLFSGHSSSGQRQEWIIATKVGESYTAGQSSYSFTARDILKSIESSLKRLQTDYLDIVLIHSDGRDKYILEESDAFETLGKLKDKGQIRSFGLSGKTLEGGLMALERSDLAMVSFSKEYLEEEEIILFAKKQGKGILVKKALGSGHISNPEQALKFVLNRAGVTSVVVGSINPQHLKENVKWACEVFHESTD